MKRPRILLLTTYYYPFLGGVESHARQLAVYLSHHGFDIVVLTKRVGRGSPVLEKIDGIPVYRIPPAGERTSLQKWIMIPCAVFMMLRLRKKFDLIYCPGYRGIGIAAILTAKLLRRPVILKSGNIGILSCSNWDTSLARWHLVPQGRLASLLKWPVHKTYASASAFACISHEIMKEALECNVLPEKLYYLPEAVNCERFRPPRRGERKQIRSEQGWPENHLVCMYVGRLSVEKGVLDLVEAWRLIAGPRAILVMVGPDMRGHHMDVGPTVRKFVAEHGMKDRLILYGPSDDIPRLLRAADIFIQPSHYEAFGLSVIEAMATGLPVIATRVGGMTDYLVDGLNALLCARASPEDIAMKISQLINEASLRDGIGREARATVAQDFKESIIFGRFAHLFMETARSQRS